jgi:hypothetical protein
MTLTVCSAFYPDYLMLVRWNLESIDVAMGFVAEAGTEQSKLVDNNFEKENN